MTRTRQTKAIGTDGYALTKSGSTPSRTNTANYVGDVPWLKSGELCDYDIWQAEESISKEALNGTTLQLLPSGTVLVAMYGATAGITGILRTPMTINQAICSIRPVNNSFNPYFLQYFLIHERPVLLRKRYGGAQPNLNQSIIRNTEVLDLPLPEQKKIAAILLKLQQAISAQDKIIQSLRDLKKSSMQHLFTHGLRGEKTKMTDIGEIPESWDVVKLGDLCQANDGCIQTGPFGSQLHASDYQASGVPVVNPTHMLDNEIVHEGIPRVSSVNADRLSRHMLESGDILFARRGEIGRHALVTEDEAGWLCGTGCFLVRLRDPRALDSFISWMLYSRQSQDWLIAHAAGAIMPNLNNKILQACPVAYPCKLGEQQQLVDTLNGLGQKIGIHESEKTALQDLFKTTLNKLMTGDIRVADLDIDVKEVEV